MREAGGCDRFLTSDTFYFYGRRNEGDIMLTNKRIRRHIIIMFGILWIMGNYNSFNCYAKTSFSKEMPIGIMSTAVKDSIAVSWEPVKGAKYYRVYGATGDGSYYLVRQTKYCKTVLRKKEAGKVYHFYVRACKEDRQGNRIYSKPSKKVSTTVAKNGTSTIKNFLQTAITPIGSTMYVWGGGWNKADTGTGKDAKRIGLSPKWRTFAESKTSAYNYRNYRYQIHDGLDCSGYVGWCIYNVLNTTDNHKGYVYSASKQAEKFAKSGFGAYIKNVKNYQAGDIMSSTCSCCGHVWIVIGECEDGSVVLVHSSPDGVQLAGTVARDGDTNSEAFKLAKKYMKKYYPKWYERYPATCKNSSYLSHYGQMRWRTTGKKVVLSDPDGYQKMSAEEILKDLFKDK